MPVPRIRAASTPSVWTRSEARRIGRAVARFLRGRGTAPRRTPHRPLCARPCAIGILRRTTATPGLIGYSAWRQARRAGGRVRSDGTYSAASSEARMPSAVRAHHGRAKRVRDGRSRRSAPGDSPQKPSAAFPKLRTTPKGTTSQPAPTLRVGCGRWGRR